MTDAASQHPGKTNALVEAYFAKRANLVLFLSARTGSHATAEDLVKALNALRDSEPLTIGVDRLNQGVVDRRTVRIP